MVHDAHACGMQLQNTQQHWIEGENCLATISSVCCMITLGFHFSLLQDNAIHTTKKTSCPIWSVQLPAQVSTTGMRSGYMSCC